MTPPSSPPPLRLLLLLLLLCGAPHLGSSGPLGAARAPTIRRHAHEHDEVVPAGTHLTVEVAAKVVLSLRGGNATLPCRFHPAESGGSARAVRVKWTRLPELGGGGGVGAAGAVEAETDVVAAMGGLQRAFGPYQGRAGLLRADRHDASLLLADVRLADRGRYRCEVVDGLEDDKGEVELELDGVVFPYQAQRGRYKLSFAEAQATCAEQGATLATLGELLQGWEAGLDWCNAGWLADGSVQYPVTVPREPCGGKATPAGLRSYGFRHRTPQRFDAFCFAAAIKGEVYYLERAGTLPFPAAVLACAAAGASLATVGQLYSAWHHHDLDRCDAGWLADGSVRYPIVSPRDNCGGGEPGVRTLGFPSKLQGRFGAYCYREAAFAA
ncbi:hyaluronan and proteoglycan link protein 3 [Lethenteron reissneri]|uniref:hyaluronan and proteoglycan link protein 3 n=1 Tax=Lethenteron reissneri TaxID=7753 RepID=UPI002AB76FCF|nr:hyaluronan and proteoglycan link protein 3 [Lethenteron reissneri]